MAHVRKIALGVAVLIVVTAGTALAASPGSPFRLGVLNTVQAITRLSGSLTVAMLQVTNNGTGPALQLIVKPGVPPMTVNSTTRVTRLNADLLDGVDSSSFLRTNGKAADSDLLDGVDSSSFLRTNGKAADSDRLDGLDPSAFMGARVTLRESAISTGSVRPDGTRRIDASCSPGEVLLSGGPANIDPGTMVLESFPFATTSTPNSWAVRIQNVGVEDAFSVVILCALPS